MAKTGWDRFDILRALRERGTNLTRLSLNSKLDASACRHAVARPQLGGEIAIASFLQRDPADIWPDRYRHPLTQRRSNALEALRASLKKPEITAGAAR